MSDTIFEAKANGLAQKNDALRIALGRDNVRMFLLKRDGQTKAFVSIAEVTVGWQVKFNEYRGQMAFRVATIDDDFADDIAQASYIGYGVPDDDDEIEVFSIDPDRRDVIAPTGSSVYWKVYAAKVANERFTVPEE